MRFLDHAWKLAPGKGQVLDTDVGRHAERFHDGEKVELRRTFRYFAFQSGDRAFECLADQPAVLLRQGIETV